MIKLAISNHTSKIQSSIFLIKALMMAIILTCLSILNVSNAFAASPSGMVSDAFSGSSLNTSVWGFYDPQGDSSVSMTGSQAAIAVPGNSNHDLWTNALFAPRIRQEANNTDFVIETKIDSSLTANAQLHGFTVEQNELNFVDFIVVYNKSQTKIFSASFINGVGTTRISAVITNSAPMYLRVTRQGNQFTFAYSANGSTWTTAGSFAHTLTVARVGLVAGNAPNTSPAYTGRFDYFMVDNEAPSSPPPASGSSSGMVSDGFGGTALNSSVWGFYDPNANCSVLMTGTQAAIAVPGNSNHDLWTNALYAPRIRQEANDTDFVIETKIDSSLTANAQFHGFTVEQNALNLLDFIVVYNKSQTKIFSATFASGVGTARFNTAITNSGAATYLRITRTGNQWKFDYSSNGTSWVNAGTYTYTLAVARVGLVAGNAPDNSPAYTGRFDYFMIDGIAPDGSTDTTPPTISNIQASTTTTTATITWNTNEPADSRVAYGSTSSYGSIASANPNNLVTSHSVTLANLAPNTSYQYQVRSADGSGNSSSSADRVVTTLNTAPQGGMVNWLRLSSNTGDLPVPPASEGQVEIRAVDLNKDGLPDYLLNMWQKAGTARDTMVWYQQQPNGSFVRYLIDNEVLNLSHSDKFKDIDGDGDLDIIIGEADKGSTINWWENPYPNYSQNTPWPRRLVYGATSTFFHDGIWGDFDGDGSDEYMSWHQKAKALLLFEKPANPKSSGQWPFTRVFTWSGGGQGYGSDHRYRGVDSIDVNLDGKLDFVGGCGWFEHTGGTNFTQHIIEEVLGYSQIKAAQLIPGGRPEILCAKELDPGPLNMYQWDGSAWQAKTLMANLATVHTIQTGDINLDGSLDIMVAEIGEQYNTTNPGLYILYGDGSGNFIQQTVFQGAEGHLEGQLADIDNDGDLDIVTKPLKLGKPLVTIWLNEGT